MVHVVPGAEAWSCAGGDVGILLLHGFTGNPVSLRPLAEDLKASGFAVELPRLPGHGARWQDCQKTGWSDWLRETIGSFEQLRARTRACVVAGLSMGALLGLELARTHPHDVAGIVAINPTIHSHDMGEKLVPLLARVLPFWRGIGNDIAKADADEKPCRLTPLRAAASLVRHRDEVRSHLRDVTVPLLVLTSRQDHTVPPCNSLIVLDEVGSTDKRHVWLERSYHVATLDHDADVIRAEMTAFARRVTQPEGSSEQADEPADAE